MGIISPKGMVFDSPMLLAYSAVFVQSMNSIDGTNRPFGGLREKKIEGQIHTHI